MNIAIIGYGYWGINLVRNFSGVENCKVKYVVDNRQERLTLVKRMHPSVQICMDSEVVMSDPEVIALIIATPVFAHYAIAKKLNTALLKQMNRSYLLSDIIIANASENILYLNKGATSTDNIKML